MLLYSFQVSIVSISATEYIPNISLTCEERILKTNILSAERIDMVTEFQSFRRIRENVHKQHWQHRTRLKRTRKIALVKKLRRKWRNREQEKGNGLGAL